VVVVVVEGVGVGVESGNAPILILPPPSLGMLTSKTWSASNLANLRPPTPGIPTTDRPTDRVNEIPAHWNCRSRPGGAHPAPGKTCTLLGVHVQVGKISMTLTRTPSSAVAAP